MLKYRLMLGPVLALVLVALLWVDQALDAAPMPQWLRPLMGNQGDMPPGVIVFGTMMLITVFAARELARILRDKSVAASTGVICVCACAGLAVTAFVPLDRGGASGLAVVSTVAGLVLVGSLAYYARKRKPEGVVAAAGGALLAFVYLGLVFGFLLLIRREHTSWVLLWVLMVTKASDIGAYFTGRALGRHKLIPWLSPGKTWEGFVGGMAASGALAVTGMPLLERPDMAWWHAGLAGCACAAVGQAGDLVMSLFKRDAGRKDSGASLPGFGGVLDVLDSTVLVGPVAYWFLAIGNGT